MHSIGGRGNFLKYGQPAGAGGGGGVSRERFY